MGLFDFLKKKKPAPAPAQASVSQRPQLRVADVLMLPAGPTTWAIRRDNASTLRLESSDAAMLERCARFRSIADHAGALGETLGLDRREVAELEQRLSAWADAGFLVSSRSIARGQPGEGVRIDLVAILGDARSRVRTDRRIVDEDPAFLARLAERARVPRESVTRAIGPGDQGLMNRAILAGAGAGVAILDGSLTGRAVRMPSSEGTTIADDPREWWPSVEMALEDVDLVAALEPALGRPLGSAISEPLSIPELSNPVLAAVTRDRLVGAVSLGVIGPSDGSQHERATAEGSSRARLVDSPHLRDHVHCRGVSRNAIGHPVTIAAPAMAFDARTIVPPFLGEDASSYGWLYAYVMQKRAVVHAPLMAETKRPLWTRSPVDLSSGRVLALAAASAGTLALLTEPADRMVELGDHLRAVARSEDLERHVEAARLESLSAWIRRLDAAHEAHRGEPKDWDTVVSEVRSSFADASVGSFTPEAIEALRASLRSASDTLSIWPTLFEAAKELR
ncbi:MAG: hypothetical protein HY791_09930 [Deltaproteobacteria bacterium]|nr:hypothetical protein [Deltaproteobacteria bacterium]